MTKDEALAALEGDMGKDSEPGEWLLVDQAMINQYVALSGETGWIHTDPELARQRTKFGNCIAPGNMGIALMPRMSRANSVYSRYPRKYSLNQGWDRIRYLEPLRAGSRIRSRSRLVSVDEQPDGSLRVAVEFRMEVENQDKPWVVGTKVGRFFY